MFHHTLNRISLSIITLILSSTTYAQLSSCTPNYSIETDTVADVSQLWMTITFDDISDLGGVQISAYDAETGEFVIEYLGNRDELLLRGHLTSEHLFFPFFQMDQERLYHFQVNPYNLGGAYIGLTEITTTL